ncbi:MAG: hypothetical protein ABSC06_10655 [Rhodopila sp.]|jgi:hypothetical protein
MWFVNIFNDVANIINAWIPLLCYLGAAFLLIVAIVYFSHLGNPGKAARGDVTIALLALFVASCLASFPAYVNAWNVTAGMPSRVAAGGELFTYLTTIPGIEAATPQQEATAMILIFMPFFRSWGAASVLRALFLLRDGWRSGVSVTWPFLAYTIAGVILANLDTLIPLVWPAAAA